MWQVVAYKGCCGVSPKGLPFAVTMQNIDRHTVTNRFVPTNLNLLHRRAIGHLPRKARPKDQ